jgi:hypothetical protein
MSKFPQLGILLLNADVSLKEQPPLQYFIQAYTWHHHNKKTNELFAIFYCLFVLTYVSHL